MSDFIYGYLTCAFAWACGVAPFVLLGLLITEFS